MTLICCIAAYLLIFAAVAVWIACAAPEPENVQLAEDEAQMLAMSRWLAQRRAA